MTDGWEMPMVQQRLGAPLRQMAVEHGGRRRVPGLTTAVSGVGQPVIQIGELRM